MIAETEDLPKWQSGFLHPTQRAHTPHTPTDSPPLPGLAHWTDIKVSALGSRVGWTLARNNERTNERPNICSWRYKLLHTRHDWTPGGVKPILWPTVPIAGPSMARFRLFCPYIRSWRYKLLHSAWSDSQGCKTHSVTSCADRRSRAIWYQNRVTPAPKNVKLIPFDFP